MTSPRGIGPSGTPGSTSERPTPGASPDAGTRGRRWNLALPATGDASTPLRAAKRGDGDHPLQPTTPGGHDRGRRARMPRRRGPAASLEYQRERNRLAADKCRRKKRQEMQTLEGNVKVLEERNRSLQSTIGTLRGEFLSLVLEGLKPEACQCGDVRRYLDSRAKEVLEGQQLTLPASPSTAHTPDAPSQASTGGGGAPELLPCGSGPLFDEPDEPDEPAEPGPFAVPADLLASPGSSLGLVGCDQSWCLIDTDDPWLHLSRPMG